VASSHELELRLHVRSLRQVRAARAALDELEAALVDRAREAGMPWTQIGNDLGISGQSAHRRHAGHDPWAARRRRLREQDGWQVYEPTEEELAFADRFLAGLRGERTSG
jgi:hypothetical protein